MPNKIFPCPECKVIGRTPHTKKCAIGKARSIASKKAHASRKLKFRPTANTRVNRIAIVLDGSQSVRGICDLLVKAVNNHLNILKKNSQDKNNWRTYVDLFTFADTVHTPIFENRYIHSISEITMAQYQIGNMTALYDAIGSAITRFEALEDNDPNTSFLIVVATDGDENNSVEWTSTALRSKITKLQNCERWTFVFTGPVGCKKNIQDDLGLYAGNIEEWKNDRQGTETMNTSLSTGYNNYMTMRSAGRSNTREFFTSNLNNVPSTAIKSLNNLSNDFRILRVDRSAPGGQEWEIRHFVEDNMRRNLPLSKAVGFTYKIGNAYYQLTKPEDVQASKDILIREKTTGAIYGGPDARELIGMPVNTLVKVTPGNHSGYDIFIKSTSVNRKLVRGTVVLYKV